MNLSRIVLSFRKGPITRGVAQFVKQGTFDRHPSMSAYNSTPKQATALLLGSVACSLAYPLRIDCSVTVWAQGGEVGLKDSHVANALLQFANPA